MSDLKQLLSTVKDEILRLRQENEVLRGKVEVMDLFSAVLNTVIAARPARETDVVWDITLAIRELDERKGKTSTDDFTGVV